ncbi:MAG: hypothetical protein AABZ15_11640 [Nitrospirota bacterium]
MKNIAIKTALFVAWPLLACGIAACVVFVLFAAWFAIPFMALTRKADGSVSYSMGGKS